MSAPATHHSPFHHLHGVLRTCALALTLALTAALAPAAAQAQAHTGSTTQPLALSYMLHAKPAVNALDDSNTVANTGDYWFSNASFDVDEDVGQFPLQITRDNTSTTGKICWGVTNADAEAGENFVSVPGEGTHWASFAVGQATATVYITINDQGINGPSHKATAFMYNCTWPPAIAGPRVTLTLLQNDPLQTRVPGNPLGYATPTDGDPLQYVNWYVFGANSPAGQAAAALARRNPRAAAELRVIANTPGSQSYRFWMWNQPTQDVAAWVEAYLADAEQAQPNTTVALSTYSLVHGNCQNPSAIADWYKSWIDQVAAGIGNFRVVMYLEEDALLINFCLSPAQQAVRESLIAYAVNALEQDPHVVVYIDAGASDAEITPRHMATMLEASGIAQAQGFAVNSTHFQWTTTEVHWGQQISALTGGAHFVVRTDSNGRGPLLNKHPMTQGIEDLCNPPGRGLGVLSWDTGYEYVDGFLWYNNPGASAGSCHGGPAVSVFWPAYAEGLVSRWVNRVTGPHYKLLLSQTNM